MAIKSDLIIQTKQGLYCPPADVWLDPKSPVDRAVITHAHADHARWGMKQYWMTPESRPILEYRVARKDSSQKFHEVPYYQEFGFNGVSFSFHPAGHVPGSAQIRIEYQGQVWVDTGDWKYQDDGLSHPFEPVDCDVFVTETTFGLPVYRWQPNDDVMDQIANWYQQNVKEGICSLLGAYALGKAQRLIYGLAQRGVKMFCHGAVYESNKRIRAAGFDLPDVPKASREVDKSEYRDAMIIAVPSSFGASWVKKFAPYSVGFASGWMQARGTRRRKGADRGFVMSDHADWDGILRAVKETGAKRVITNHGYTSQMAKFLTEEWGLETSEFRGHFHRSDDED
jgi:putative mRNA 3-end processing factor